MSLAITVPGAERLPFPFGIDSWVDWRNTSSSSEMHWLHGVKYMQQSCEPLPARGLDVCAVIDDRDATNAGGYGEATPFAVYSFTECGAGGQTVEEREQDALARLLAREQTAVEKEFWTGAAGAVPSILGSAILNSEVPDPYLAMRMAEDFISENYGSLGVIHMSRGMATQVPRDLVEREGRLYSKVGTPIIAGSGYPVDAIAATPAIFGFRSETTQYTASGAQVGFDRKQNVRYALAERDYLLGMDDCGTAIFYIRPEGS